MFFKIIIFICKNTCMESNVIFNISICFMGVAILLIHIVNLVLKKRKREDEYALMNFLIFTAFHFAVYLIFSFIKSVYTSNVFIIAFYTAFYVFNNLEVFLLFLYMLTYVEIKEKMRKVLFIVNGVLFAVFIVLDLTNIFSHLFFYAVDGVYTRNSLMFISQGYQFVMLAIVLLVTLINDKLVIREKIAFAFYCLIPVVAIILQNIFKGYAIAYASIIVAIEVLFFFVNVSKNIQLAEEQKKNKEAQIKVMMSQIQPHFVYNSLSAISTLIKKDPERAQVALDEFTDYLRHNLAALTETKLIPFDKELKHIQTYIDLEKIRFGDRINVIYDIQVRDFNVPTLSIQPIVENAIKHGILKKLEGGTLTFKTYDSGYAYVVEVIDDGVGFFMNPVDFQNNMHFGINNIKYRLKSMCSSDIKIESEINKGTKVVITFFK